MKRIDQAHLQPPDRLAAMEVSRSLKARLPVEEVILFGSKARGDDTRDSDMDVLVLLKGDRPADASRQVWDALWDIQMRYPVGLSPLVVSADQWHHGLYQATLLKKEIERDGVVL